MRKLFAAFAVAAIAVTIAVWAPWASGAGSSYEPVLDPADFTTTIDNPYFPLPVGRTLVYQGVKDGQSQVDTVTVTNQTKLVAEGITARVVTDVATHDGAKPVASEGKPTRNVSALQSVELELNRTPRKTDA